MKQAKVKLQNLGIYQSEAYDMIGAQHAWAAMLGSVPRPIQKPISSDLS